MISYPEDSKSEIQWDHIDGPLFHGKDGCLHWLTLVETLMFRVGLMSISDLERKYNNNPQRG